MKIIFDTYCNVDVQGASYRRFEMSIENDRPKEHFMTRLVDGFVCLNKDGVALVDIM